MQIDKCTSKSDLNKIWKNLKCRATHCFSWSWLIGDLVLNQFGNVRASSSLHTWQEGWEATKFSLESVWKYQGLLLSSHMTGRARGQPNSELNQSGNVWASSFLHTWQVGWEGYKKSVLNQSGNVRVERRKPWHFQTDSRMNLVASHPSCQVCRVEDALTFPDWFKTEFGFHSPFLSGVQRGEGPDFSRLIRDWIWLPSHPSCHVYREEEALTFPDWFKTEFGWPCIFQILSTSDLHWITPQI